MYVLFDGFFFLFFFSVYSNHGMAGQPTVINFSLLSKTCEDKGINMSIDEYIISHLVCKKLL